MIPLYEMSIKGKSIQTISRSVVTMGKRAREMGNDC